MGVNNLNPNLSGGAGKFSSINEESLSKAYLKKHVVMLSLGTMKRDCIQYTCQNEKTMLCFFAQ